MTSINLGCMKIEGIFRGPQTAVVTDRFTLAFLRQTFTIQWNPPGHKHEAHKTGGRKHHLQCFSLISLSHLQISLENMLLHRHPAYIFQLQMAVFYYISVYGVVTFQQNPERLAGLGAVFLGNYEEVGIIACSVWKWRCQSLSVSNSFQPHGL